MNIIYKAKIRKMKRKQGFLQRSRYAKHLLKSRALRHSKTK